MQGHGQQHGGSRVAGHVGVQAGMAKTLGVVEVKERGAIDHGIDLPQAADGVGHERSGGGLVAQVGLQHQASHPQRLALLCGGLRLLGRSAVVNHHRPALGREGQRHVATQALGRAGDEHHAGLGLGRRRGVHSGTIASYEVSAKCTDPLE